MRELFVTDLAKNLLGPRGGTYEELRSSQSPFSEYVTGMLAPDEQDQGENRQETAAAGDLPADAPTSHADDDMGGNDEAAYAGTASPTIDPSQMPSSMGLSFYVETKQAAPRFDVCLTWSKYLQQPDGGWKRDPRKAVFAVSPPAKPTSAPNDNPEVEFSLKSARIGESKHHVSMFMKNVSPGKKEQTIFQAQIRVVCASGTSLIPAEDDLDGAPEGEQDSFAYRKKQSYGKGHMTSVVWSGIDPERLPSDMPQECSRRADQPPFAWADEPLLEPDDAVKFKNPDIRTEFLPMLSVPSPETGWDAGAGRAPLLKAAELAKLYDPGALREALSPIPDGYEKWIGRMEAEKDGSNDELVSRIQDECRAVLSRINGGIDRLANDDDARLAFCFANKAVDLAYRWPGAPAARDGMEYRPFQLAFALMSLDSVVDPKSPHRDVCDMLWVPTAAGKTEAYLVLAALSISHRRLRETKSGKSGAGVDVLSRYTLRLLTMQQFKRTLKLICAAEALRVDNLQAGSGSGPPVGWRPPGCADARDFLWGSTPFSLGLWVGGAVTPNRLEDGGRESRIKGAISVLKSGGAGENGDPAQVITCPACDGTLAVLEKGLAASKKHAVPWVVKTGADLASLRAVRVGPGDAGTDSLSIGFDELPNSDYKIMTAEFALSYDAGREKVASVWKGILGAFESRGVSLELACMSPTRPGYFARRYATDRSGLKEYDFDIVCPGRGCPLNEDWMGGAEYGRVADTSPSLGAPQREPGEAGWDDGNRPIEALPCFAKSAHVSCRIPITAMTVDDQVYRHAPTVVIATVDKFARLPFEPQAGILFGNAEWHHSLHGYYRLAKNHPEPHGRTERLYDNVRLTRRPSPPSLIIQDELHLIEGPLGSLVGLYEACIDFLASGKNYKPKYVAATATIKNGKDQARSLFARGLQVFPPAGPDVSDRFFVREAGYRHPILDEEAGRLYMGLLAPGKGALTPLVRAWARMAQTGHLARKSGAGGSDDFWTVTGYFNAIRDLAGARALYMQDIPVWIRQIDPDDPRNIHDTEVKELSGRMKSSDIPPTLEILEREFAADGLLTTSMFGTGVDIRRIGAMVVVGQPKTASSYIQSTGRVGRKRGGIVLVFYRAVRPRDLSHYEYFGRNHVQLHRMVEPPTVSPFSSGTMDRCLGPVMVGMLRNKRTGRSGADWALDESASVPSSGDSDIRQVIDYIADRSQAQPDGARPARADVERRARACMDRWKSVAGDGGILYVEYNKADHAVVLGDLLHESRGRSVVFHSAPQSLRNVEEEAGFEG